MKVTIPFVDVSPHKTQHLYMRVTDNGLVSNWEEYSQKDGRPYANILTAINGYSLIIVDAVLLPNTSDNTFC